MKQFGLLGYPLGHSFSKKYFDKKIIEEGIDASFNNYELESADDLVEIIENTPTLMGFAITIPHKENVIALLDEQDAAIAAIGAVNCVKINREDGRAVLKGYNTDIIGFERSFCEFLKPEQKLALILGTGGASKAVAYVLAQLNIEYQIVSRRRGDNQISYEDVSPEMMQKVAIVVNTTPLGMYPKVDACPDLPYESITSSHYFYDLVYNPIETLFLKKAKERGAIVKAGMDMLELQAEANWDIWNA